MNDLKERLKEFLRIKNYSPHTISNYERDINRLTNKSKKCYQTNSALP